MSRSKLRALWIALTVLLAAPPIVLGVRSLRRKPENTAVSVWLPYTPNSALPSPGDAPPNYHARDLTAILRRNVFDSTLGPVVVVPDLPGMQAQRAAMAPVAPVNDPSTPCQSTARITGAVDSVDGQLGLVYLSPAPSQRSIELRVGDVFEERNVHSIGWTSALGAYVVFDGTEKLGPCTLAQFGVASPVAVDAGVIATPPVVQPPALPPSETTHRTY